MSTYIIINIFINYVFNGVKMKILIYGLPGSGKTTLAEPLAKLINGVHLNADQVREKYEGPDKSKWDFTEAGRHIQSVRMRYLAEGVEMADKVAVADFVCPTEELRKAFGADFTIWMDTIKKGRFADTNAIFQKPNKSDVDYHVAKWFDDTHTQLVPVINRYMEIMKKHEINKRD